MRNEDFDLEDEELEEGVFNVYEILPPDGTILEMATAQEMVRAAELEAKHAALVRLQESSFQFSNISFKEVLAEFEEFERESMDFWTSVYSRLRIPWAWTIRVDVANGPIYVVNERPEFLTYDDDYEDDDVYDEYEEDDYIDEDEDELE